MHIVRGVHSYLLEEDASSQGEISHQPLGKQKKVCDIYRCTSRDTCKVLPKTNTCRKERHVSWSEHLSSNACINPITDGQLIPSLSTSTWTADLERMDAYLPLDS